MFRTDKGQEAAQASSDYFLDSAEGVHFFLEKGGLDLMKTQNRTKGQCLNKVGHDLHSKDPVFAKYSQSAKVAALTRVLGYVDPVLPQSMYIFKQANGGDEVTSHQDACFLHTEPRLTCLGLWLALQDATIENGCIWARPGSQKEGLRKRFSRNPEYFVDGNKEATMMKFDI